MLIEKLTLLTFKRSSWRRRRRGRKEERRERKLKVRRKIKIKTFLRLAARCTQVACLAWASSLLLAEAFSEDELWQL